MQKRSYKLPEWEDVLSAASHLQQIFPGAVLVGGTASAIYAKHRMSTDADHIVPGVKEHFDEILEQLESVSGWKTARIMRPVQILGSLDGIETGIRNLIRSEPLETVVKEVGGQKITLPSEEEILRIKAALILQRNATRDYIDFLALAEHLGVKRAVAALKPFDRLYPQPNGESPTQQLITQLATPLPYDLKDTNLANFKSLEHKWQDWEKVKLFALNLSMNIFEDMIPNPSHKKTPSIGKKRAKKGIELSVTS
jgi:hypothetical protein